MIVKRSLLIPFSKVRLAAFQLGKSINACLKTAYVMFWSGAGYKNKFFEKVTDSK